LEEAKRLGADRVVSSVDGNDMGMGISRFKPG
jgi:hypothetical protein